jgi:hypothetical protein
MMAKMDYYKLLLESLRSILFATGNEFWANWIAEDILLWECEHSVVHHLNAFGGMGSLIDFYVSVDQMPWANCILVGLMNLSHGFAHAYSRGKVTELAGFQEYEEYKEFAKSIPSDSFPVEGIRGMLCLTCNFLWLNKKDVDNYIAPKIVAQEIIDGLENGRLELNMRNCLSMNSPAIETERTRVKNSINKQSHVSYPDKTVLKQPCIRCESGNTAAYRWHAREKFFVSQDNLAIRKD